MPLTVESRKLRPTTPEKVFSVLVLLYSTGAFWRIFQGPHDVESSIWMGAPLTNALWILAYFLAYFLIHTRCDVPAGLWRTSLPLLLPIPIAILSLVWSDDRLLTFLRCGSLVGTTLVALYIALRYSLREILFLLAWALGIAATASLIAVLLVPSFGLGTEFQEGLWWGVFGHKNEMGGMMMIAFLVYLVLLWYERSHKMVWFSFAALSLFLIVKADSMTSFVVCCALTYLLWASNKTLGSEGRTSIRVLYFALPALALTGVLALNFDSLTEALGRGVDLNGRVVLWLVVSGAIVDRPYLGYGYQAFWRGYEGASGQIWNQMGQFHYYSHNGFLEILLGTGLLGLVSILIAFGLYAKKALALLGEQPSADAVWPWAFFLYLIGSNLLEGALMKANYLPWFLYTITALSLCVRALPGALPKKADDM
jgi:exopolysaccharide production protein ExoQ